MTTKPLMEPQYICEVETKKYEETIDNRLIEENIAVLKNIEAK